MLTEGELEDVWRFLSCRLGTEHRVDRLVIVCLGCEIDADKIPRAVWRWLPPPRGGWWCRQLGVGIARVGYEEQTRRILIHEIGHGLIEEMTPRFRFPPALEEGIVGTIEWTLPDPNGISADARDRKNNASAGRSVLRENDCMSIWALLSYRHGDLTLQSGMSAHTRAAMAALWFYAFLGVAANSWPKLDRLYETVWKSRMNRPSGIYRWILDTTGLDAESLEGAFRQFCLTRICPRFDA